MCRVPIEPFIGNQKQRLISLITLNTSLINDRLFFFLRATSRWLRYLFRCSKTAFVPSLIQMYNSKYLNASGVTMWVFFEWPLMSAGSLWHRNTSSAGCVFRLLSSLLDLVNYYPLLECVNFYPLLELVNCPSTSKLVYTGAQMITVPIV